MWCVTFAWLRVLTAEVKTLLHDRRMASPKVTFAEGIAVLSNDSFGSLMPSIYDRP